VLFEFPPSGRMSVLRLYGKRVWTNWGSWCAWRESNPPALQSGVILSTSASVATVAAVAYLIWSMIAWSPFDATATTAADLSHGSL
jgi:hypothetical protein